MSIGLISRARLSRAGASALERGRPPLDGPHGAGGAFGDLPQVEPLAGIQQEKLEHGQPRARGDQRFCDRGRMYIFLSHLYKKYIRRARALSSGAPPAAWKGWEK